MIAQANHAVALRHPTSALAATGHPRSGFSRISMIRASHALSGLMAFGDAVFERIMPRIDRNIDGKKMENTGPGFSCHKFSCLTGKSRQRERGRLEDQPSRIS